MEPFKTHSGLVIPFNRANVDTDAILPKQYLKMLGKAGYGDFLFDDERYLDPGDVDIPVAERRPNPDFILNRSPFERGTILLAGANFGCGSSREHAVWALHDFGIRVVLAPSFGDIFFNNCFNNGLLPVILAQPVIDKLFELASRPGKFAVNVDLERCELVHGEDLWPFVVEPGRRDNLLSGLDDIGRTLAFGEAIRDYEARRRHLEPWIFR
ncbi:3-isopropylmalate/(R)-2-methylmalate dehydratase small subunit [Marinobacter antarcticus]|uniref:3-isopropylmalate dehydratase small subunit n=1 Tax=Marinobacter antarcticus TaxID=564117 RepID=A0A1M6RIJ5_9GAMM|nr:3-isopropylmalate dehydratase small subunit [Marinobacter antarcticus]SHK32253.1 3-isopropylmalate/(R)-2-methylmalate dehydratase small subunit [Marinobacter antarcticus]